MSEKVRHPIFDDAPSDDAPLWRYMKFHRLKELLEGARLRFLRVDKFDDHFEGVWPLKDALIWQRVGPVALNVTEMMRRSKVAASCWINLPNESAGMWRLFAPGNEGVAIRTTFGKLRAVTEAISAAVPGATAGAARVRYLDHAADSLIEPLGPNEGYPNAFVPFMLKHVSYAYEHEVRALVVAPHDQEIEPEGLVSPPLDLAEFIDDIVVNPVSEEAFENSVVELAKRYGMHSATRSALHRRRFYIAERKT